MKLEIARVIDWNGLPEEPVAPLIPSIFRAVLVAALVWLGTAILTAILDGSTPKHPKAPDIRDLRLELWVALGVFVLDYLARNRRDAAAARDAIEKFVPEPRLVVPAAALARKESSGPLCDIVLKTAQDVKHVFDRAVQGYPDNTIYLYDVESLRSVFDALQTNRISKIEVFDHVESATVPCRVQPDRFGRMSHFQRLLFRYQKNQKLDGGNTDIEWHYLVDRTTYDTWQNSDDVVAALFECSNPGQTYVWHVFNEAAQVPDHYCPFWQRAKPSTDLFVSFSGVLRLWIHTGSVMHGEKYGTCRIVMSPSVASTRHAALSDGTQYGLPQAAIEQALLRRNPVRMAVFQAINGGWLTAQGDVASVDISLSQNNIESWESDSFYQYALDRNREAIDYWKAQSLDRKFVRLFLVPNKLAESLLREGAEGKRDVLGELLLGQLDAGVVVLVTPLKRFLGKISEHGCPCHSATECRKVPRCSDMVDFNHVDGQVYALKALVRHCDGEEVVVGLHPFHDFDTFKVEADDCRGPLVESLLSDFTAPESALSIRVDNYVRKDCATPSVEVQRLLEDVQNLRDADA